MRKVEVPNSVTHLNRLFFQLAHFSWNTKHTIRMICLANPNQDCSHFPHGFRSPYEYLIQYQSEDSHAQYR
jgi:hypothetical protein